MRPKLTFPDDVAQVVTTAYQGAQSLLEYGSGGSTVLAAEIGVEHVVSVESDAAWFKNMESWFAAHPSKGRVSMHLGDIGPTRAWGRPQNDRAFRQWPNYALSVWERADFVAPDLVLIDGRFRLACFLTTYIRTQKPVTVLWDDYVNRPPYHAAERLLKPVAMVGRLARFEITPAPFPVEHLSMLAQSYLSPL